MVKFVFLCCCQHEFLNVMHVGGVVECLWACICLVLFLCEMSSIGLPAKFVRKGVLEAQGGTLLGVTWAPISATLCGTLACTSLKSLMCGFDLIFLLLDLPM